VCPDETRGASEGDGGGGPIRAIAVSSEQLDERDTARHDDTVCRPYATGDRHFAIRGLDTHVSADVPDSDPTDSEAALEAALSDLDGAPECAVCPSSADFFLWEAGRVEKFVCWEHVSPVSAAVGGEPGAVERPIAIRLE